MKSVSNKKNKFQNIIFDLDGTLADSEEGIINSILYALKKLNIAEQNPEDLISFIGPPLIESVMTRYGLDLDEANEAVRFYREYFSKKGVYENRLYDGISDMLDLLTRNRKKLYLATSKPDVYVDIILPYFKIDHFFHGISAANIERDILHKKDVLKVLFTRYTNLEKAKCVMIGDRKHDIYGAHENGLAAIGVTWGFGSPEELIKEKPYAIANSIDELIKLVI